jgi:transaldolase
MPSLLNNLRARSALDCDTLDLSVAAELGPFSNCTSNQAIAYFELQEHRNKDLLVRAANLAKELESKYDGVSLVTLAAEIAVSCLYMA